MNYNQIMENIPVTETVGCTNPIPATTYLKLQVEGMAIKALGADGFFTEHTPKGQEFLTKLSLGEIVAEIAKTALMEVGPEGWNFPNPNEAHKQRAEIANRAKHMVGILHEYCH